MQLTPQIVVYVLLLAPGLLGASVFSAFTFTREPSWTGRTVVAIVLAALSYTSLALLRQWEWLAWLPDPATFISGADKGLVGILTIETLLSVAAACVLVLAYALGLTVAHNQLVCFRLAQWLGLTTKTGFSSEWDAVMLTVAQERWVMVQMKDGTAFTGWLRQCDVVCEKRCVVLSHVREYDKDGSSFLLPRDELVVIANMDYVRNLRLIPIGSDSHEQEGAGELDTDTQTGDEICESEPEVPAKDQRPSLANAASETEVARSTANGQEEAAGEANGQSTRGRPGRQQESE